MLQSGLSPATQTALQIRCASVILPCAVVVRWSTSALNIPSFHLNLDVFHCPSCIPPHAESCGQANTAWMQFTDPEGWHSALDELRCFLLTKIHTGGTGRSQGWSREPYLILLFAEQAGDDPRPPDAGKPEVLQRWWGLRAGVQPQVGLTAILPSCDKKITPIMVVRF